jgi:hypothetical protein
VAVSAAGAGFGTAGLARGLGAGLAGVARGAGVDGVVATTLSGRGAVFLTAGVAVSACELDPVSAPDAVAVSLPGTEPDRRSPPQLITVAEANRHTIQSWTLQPLIIRSTLSMGAAGPDISQDCASHRNAK